MELDKKLVRTELPWMFQIAVPTPFRVGPINAYLIEGDSLTLIDNGPRTDEAYDYIEDALAERGYRMADLERLVITHHHIDHLGLTRRIVDESGAKVVCHPYCKPFLVNQTETFGEYIRFTSILYQRAGVPHEIFSQLENSKTWYDEYGTPPVAVAEVIEEGDTLYLGDRQWRVYYTPGHAGDLICFYDPTSKILLASDHLILKISSNPLIEPSPIEGDARPRRLIEYIHHMQRMAALDIDVAYSGHGAPITDIKTLVEKRIGFHNQRAQAILELFEGQAFSLWQMTEKMFSHVGPGDKYLALSEVLGHIDILEKEGRLERFFQDNVVYWKPVD